MTHDTTHLVGSASGNPDARNQLGSLLGDFVANVRSVTHALLISRDGLSLVDSQIHKDFADKWAATLGTLASLCESIPGPHGGSKGLKLAVVEREDAWIFAAIAGSSAAFPDRPGSDRGLVDTVLAVIAEPEADAGTVGYEMGLLIDQFAPYMVEPVRSV
ncbi:roadblock/LC7 domain-containing protein [Streptomyces chartreusis]|uniref:Roadblock/LC7 domain-containing protein n=1 Tax=Streptomyces chartreusis TaxID=1969 RepID=A0A7H8TBM7_STRCX|nr:roadblock/LC7 domain-containing protein [Streptomyces chartreusis]QKZ20362.1 roadblock/LC7 domain-containing protein [Streptomyces chartreusis]